MSDCTNVEIRELLPEYLHDRLGASDRARVDAHLAGCEECRSELATLRSVRQALRVAPPVDVAAIVRALPKPNRQRQVARRSFSRTRVLQIAAVISFISLGGISLAVSRSFFGGGPSGAVDTLTTPSVATVASASSQPAMTFAGGVSDLSSDDVESLLGSIESLEASPPVEPDAPASQTDIGRVRSDSSGE